MTFTANQYYTTGTLSTATSTGSVITVMSETPPVSLSDYQPLTTDGNVLVRKGPKPRKSPKIFFKFVKAKIKEDQKELLEQRLKSLAYLLDSTIDLGQEALCEELKRQILLTVRRQELSVTGCGRYVSKKDIERFKNSTTENISLDKLENFPRPIPKVIGDTILRVKETKIFDEYWVLYTNPNMEKLKSTKDKIIEKDPILFGKISEDKDNLYYIADWVDEFCGLTMEQLMTKLSEIDPNYVEQTVKEITPEQIDEMRKEIKMKDNRLTMTNRSNFRMMASTEAVDTLPFKLILTTLAVKIFRPMIILWKNRRIFRG